ncbi:MAG: hypothetical protein GX589_01045 [Deltaproteobacteria bacterium]|nr:hypothetical protein [Deltaproteobacteria bacterium]
MKNLRRDLFETDMVGALAIDGGEVAESNLSVFLLEYLGEELAGRVRAEISEDLRFFRSLDPASTEYSEVQILSVRRGMAAVAAHRIFAALLAEGGNLYDLEVVAKYVQKDTNVEIHPGAQIGVPFAIDHGHGTVIGATTRIGKRNFIYHGVTLGASKRFTRVGRRHPLVGDNVFFGNGSQVLGPSIIADDVKLACSVRVRDCEIGAGVHIAMDVRLAGVKVPAGVQVLGYDQEKLNRYLVRSSDNQDSAVEWRDLDAFDAANVD